MLPKRLVMASVLITLAFFSTSCTLAKPIVCAVTGPAYILGSGDCSGCAPRDAACALVAMVAFGAVGGLVTGIISDINWICGTADDPTRNFHDPFATNVSDGSFSRR